MTSPVFDEEQFIAAIVSSYRDDYSLNHVDILLDKYNAEIVFGSETEKLILAKLREESSVDSPIWDQSLYSYLLNQLEYEMDDCDNSDADTDCED